MRIAGIQRDSITNGIGVRDVIFVQGCSHRCKGCQNPHTWDYNGGEHRFVGDIIKELSDSTNDVTISGGEPFHQYESLVLLVQDLHRTGKRIWIYTGNTVDIHKPIYHNLAPWVDVIVDGKYMEELKDGDLRFKGSSNQRIIDLKKSAKAHEIIEWEETYE